MCRLLKPTLLTIFSFLFLTFTSLIQAEDCTSLYVSPLGSDHNNGSINSPFLTLPRAQQEVRSLLRANPPGKIVVYLRGGTYYLNSTLEFTTEDSGSNLVSWQAYPGELPIISGGKELSGQWANEGTNVWSISAAGVLDDHGQVKQLFRDNSRLRQSRFPSYSNPNRLTFGSVSPDKKTFTFNNFTLPDNLGASAEMMTFVQYNSPLVPIAYKNGNGVTLKNRASFPPPPGSDTSVDNNPELRDSALLLNLPVEAAPDTEIWEYDSTRQLIRIKTNSPPTNSRFLIPTLDRLVSVNNASNLSFTGIAFKHARGWQLHSYPDGEYLYINQAGLKILNKDVFYSANSWFPAAFSVYNSDHISFLNNSIDQVGGEGLEVGKGNKNITIDSNIFTDIGNSCLILGSLWDPPHASNLMVTNNEIHNCGVLNPSTVALWAGYLQNSQVSHNFIYNTPYSGLNIGWWGPAMQKYDPNNNTSNQFLNNRIHAVCLQEFDCGGIYTLGQNPNSAIAGNAVFDIRLHPQSYADINMGIYFDANSAGFSVSDNMVWSVKNPTYYMWWQTLPSALAPKNTFSLGTNYLGVPPDAPSFPTYLFNITGAVPKNHQTELSACQSTITSINGDLTGDGRVDENDLVKLKSQFGNPYTIFDYNNLIINFGK